MNNCELKITAIKTKGYIRIQLDETFHYATTHHFLILLMLSISSYSVQSYDLVSAASDDGDAIAAQGQMKNVITIASISYGVPMKLDGIHSGESRGEEKEDAVGVATQYWNDAQAVTANTNFRCTDNNTCKTVICEGGPIYDLQYEFDYIFEWCGNKFFDVIIENCTFNQNTISRSTFSGNFKMSTLTIRNCTLDTIVDNAFNYQTLNVLTNLTFVGTQLKALNAQTFLGLETVDNFQLFNVLKQETLPLKANNFLQPMAASLSNLVLQQREESGCSNAIYDPTEWLGGNSGTVYSKLLYVDLSGTNFNDTLNGHTFAKLSAMQELRLANCSLSTIAENVSTGIMSTLKSLDLRYNRLQTLDGELLAAAIPKGINMELGWNMWRCDCDNMETIEYMKQIKNNSAADTVCATPTELEGTQIRFAQLKCHDTTVLTTIMITSTPTEITTTIAMETTTTMVTTTDSTTREPTGPISQETSTSSPNTITTSTLPISTANITSTTASGKTEKNTDSTTTISADTTTVTSSSTTSIILTTTGDGTEETTDSNSETSSMSSTTANDNSTSPTSSSDTSISPTTTNDGTEETTESNSETQSTSSTTANQNSTLPTSSSGTSISPTTTDDGTEETTESNSETQSTSSATANQNSTLPTSSSDTSKMPTTSDSTIINTTQSNPGTPSISSTTTNHNPILSTSSFATSITPTTTESIPKTSATTSATTINQSTLSTSSSTTIMTLATPDDSAEETTVSTSSAAASIHRW